MSGSKNCWILKYGFKYKDIVLATIIKKDELLQGRQYYKVNYDRNAYETDCTTTNRSQKTDLQLIISRDIYIDYPGAV